jgi:hypothetical protein
MTTDQPTRTPGIRGEERIALVEALALGEETHETVASRFSRTVQAIHQFSARNHAEIDTRKRELQGELAGETSHIRVANQAKRIAIRNKLIEDMEIRLDGEDLDPRVRSRFTRDIDMLQKSVAEELGQLPPRTSKVEVAHSPLTDFDTIALDTDGNWHGVVDR